MTTATGQDRFPASVQDDGRVELVDWFPEVVRAGELSGTTGPAGAGRLVTDVEGCIGADNGALRIRPLATPGWGRAGVAYGPFPRRAGLLVAVHALNGHNASQTWYHPETRRQRWRRRVGEARRLWRTRRSHHYENFAVGWFPSPAPLAPERSGNGFVMHSASEENGELWADVDGGPFRAAIGIQNVEIVYAVVLRERGATYFAASVEGSRGLGGYPSFRPVAVDIAADDAELYAGVHQRILGEVGYRVDTRINWVCVADCPSLAGWSSGAMVADPLVGDGMALTITETGHTWLEAAGARLEPHGLTADGPLEALVTAEAAVGLVHAVVTPVATGRAGLLWRASTSEAWRCLVGLDACELARRGEDGSWQIVAVDRLPPLCAGSAHALQITDDGTTMGVHLDGRQLFGGWTDDEERGACVGFGVALDGHGASVRAFEGHAREVRLPLTVGLRGPWQPSSGLAVVDERFDGTGDALDGASTPSGRRTWRRLEGDGAIDLLGGAARVRADVEHPHPGRTIHALDWDDPGFADLRLDMTPPGSAKGQDHECRCGLVLWQDEENYLVANIFLDNLYDGASISTFFRSRGHEDMYDAVWTLVRPVRFGAMCSLRLVCDGTRFLAFLGDRPSLHRAFTDVYPDAQPLNIHKVGIVVNREWGDDTGTVLHRFVARAAPLGGDDA